MFTIGVGGYKIALSPGSRVYELELSTGGHLMLPCTDYKKPKFAKDEHGEAFVVNSESTAGSSAGESSL